MRSYEKYVSSDSDYYVYTPSMIAKKLFFYPICTGRFYYQAGYTLKRNHYDSFLLMMITDGHCSVIQNGKENTAVAGQIALIDCYAPHQYLSDIGWTSVWLHFDGPLCRNYYEYIVNAHGNIITPSPSSIRKLTDIYYVFCSGRPVIEAEISNDISSILADLLPDCQKETASSIKPSLSNTVSYINEHFAEPLTLNQLAGLSSLSPYYFTRLFTDQTGMTPHQYLISVRLNAAKFLLKTTDLPVKEIAFSCGFNSESGFCTSFRKREHLTPSEYRDFT